MSNRKYKCNENYFSIINTEAKAYWLGFIYADGCIMIHKNNKSKILSIGLCNSDKKHLEKFKKDIEFNGNIRNREHIINDNTYYGAEIVITNNKIYDDLIEHGVRRNKTACCVFPTSEQVPDILLPHFIRGFMDGDGSIAKIKKNNDVFDYKLSFVGTIEMMRGIKNFFKSNNKIIQDTRCNIPIYTFEMHGVRKVERALDLLYKDSTIYLQRKHDRYLELKQQNIKVDFIKRQGKEIKNRTIRAKRKEGKSYATISKETGYSITYINNVLKKENQHQMELDKILIRQLYSKGVSKLQIHHRTGRSRDWIRKVVKDIEKIDRY